MGLKEFSNMLRQWDNRSSQWKTRNFYTIFFEIILVILFVAVFSNALKIIIINSDIGKTATETSITDRLLLAQTMNTLFIALLLLFNSFWILYTYSSLLRLRTLLKNIDFNLSKRRSDQRSNSN